MSAHEGTQSVPEPFREPDRAEDGRLMYYEHQVQPQPRYSGPLSDLTLDEVRELGCEFLSYSGVASWCDFPLPPAGLPGKLHETYDTSEKAWELLTIGVNYVSATVFNERRSMHHRWQEARDFIRKLEWEAGERAVRAYCEAECERMRKNAVEAPPQLVYFIASERGPIKIGIAVNPQDRLRGLQTGHHEKLSLLATCPGGMEREKEYHARFKAYRINGEWFERSPEIEAEIEQLANYVGG